MDNLLAQLVGIIGMILLAVCFQAKNKKKTLILKFSADIAWGIHYLLLGGISAVVLNIIGALRETIFYFEKNEKRMKAWLVVFVTLNWVIGILKMKELYTLLPTMCSAVATYSFWQKDLKVTRLLGLVNAVIMFTYDIFLFSYVGMVNEAITVISVLIALYRYRKKDCAINQYKNTP
jgi:hypothetical protein